MTNEEQIRNPTGLETPMSFLRISTYLYSRGEKGLEMIKAVRDRMITKEPIRQIHL